TYNSGGYGADSVAVADVNGDGNLDVVVSNTSQAWSENSPVGSMGILLGNGDGTFQPPINYGIYDTEQIYQGGSCSVALADLNGDGKPDIVVESSQNTTNATFFFAYVGVLLNNYGAPSTTTSLASNVNPVGLTQSVTYTATVNQSGQSVAGSVVFSDAGVPIGQATLANNQAAFTTRYSSSKLVGPHAITATYSGALQSAESSQSAALTQYVGNTATKTTVATSGSPSVVGQSVTFTATTTAAKYGPVLDGETVSFYSGTTLLGTATTTSGVATFTTSFPAAKTYSIKATFQGNGFFKASSGTVKQVVSKTAPAAPGPPADESAKSSPDPLDANAPCGTSIALITSGSPSLFSNDVTFTAQVNENQYCRNSHILSCQGIVDFYDGKTLIGSPVVTGSCIVEADTQNLTVKSHYIKAIYEPGDGWHSNSAHLTQVVQKWPTSTALTSSANPSTYRQDVTFTAIVTSTQQGPTTPSGQVRFLNGTKALGAATLDENGMATFTTKILPVGTNSITAIYRGDSINASDTSAPLSQTVNQAPAKQ
ncbi:MAG: Ig-like domain repeat protein, partial [Terriglobales bacterium]